MDNFYDVNNFLMFMFKKWKTMILIILLGALLFTGNRAVGLLKDYRNQSDVTAEEKPKTSDNTEPMWAKVHCIVEITPLYEETEDGGTGRDLTPFVIEAYRKMSSSETVLSAMYDRWYEAELNEYKARVKKFQAYGYILDKEVNYPFAERDFYSQFVVNNEDVGSALRTKETYDERLVMVGFRSTDEELARQVAEDYTVTLSEAVKNTVGDFEYKIVDTSVMYELPAASSGTQTTRVTSAAPAAEVITVNQIIKQCIKGCVWGAVLGGFVAVILVFFMYMMTRKVYLLSDIKKFGLPVLGAGFLKGKKINSLRANFHASLEGGNWDKSGYAGIAKRMAGMTDGMLRSQKVVVTGSCKDAHIRKLVKEMNVAAGQERFVFAEGLNVSSQVLRQVREVRSTKILLVEKFGETLKDNVEFEIEELKKFGADIMGIVVLE